MCVCYYMLLHIVAKDSITWGMKHNVQNTDRVSARNGRRVIRAIVWVLVGIVALVLVAFLWLRTSPAWAGITLFSERYRVENFRNIDAIFPHSQTVAAGEQVWEFDQDLRPLPIDYDYEGQERSVAEFLDRTVTTGLLVVQGGTIVHEEYRLGADRRSPFTSWSIAKSVLSALIGIAIDEGHIDSVHDPIGRYVPAVIGSGYEHVTIEDALTMSSGVGFDEDYLNPTSDINMLFIRTLAMDMPIEQIIADLESVREPGVYNEYVSSDSMALGLVLEHATGVSAGEYLETRLWGPMGAEADASWNSDGAGRAFGLCCLNATLRDYARFGRLYLEEGSRDGVPIVPAQWVRESVNPTAPHLQPGDNPASFWTFGYGYQWWIPEQPQGDFLAIGIWGQYIYVDPVRQILVVKTSADPLFDERDAESVAVFRAIARAVARQ